MHRIDTNITIWIIFNVSRKLHPHLITQPTSDKHLLSDNIFFVLALNNRIQKPPSIFNYHNDHMEPRHHHHTLFQISRWHWNSECAFYQFRYSYLIGKKICDSSSCLWWCFPSDHVKLSQNLHLSHDTNQIPQQVRDYYIITV